MRLVFFGSGAFGVPTLDALSKRHEIEMVVTQPDRPAGRQRQLTRTPIAAVASMRNLPTIKPEGVNAPATVQRLRDLDADAFVIIAFGQKLGRPLLDRVFAVNLHASLLPKYRGAAPINWAIINGERETGVSVIALADRMDAGEVYAMQAVTIDPRETAGELHDRLASLGPEIVADVLRKRASNAAIGQPQDDRLATPAPKLSKAEGTARFDQSATAVRNRIHGLTPWPGCTVRLDGRDLKLLRADAVEDRTRHGVAGEILQDQSIACMVGSLRLLEVQPPGREPMTWQAYRNGHAVRVGSRLEPLI